ncbi:MAG: citrate/2-methylcitrate synthase [Gammaproteobacteria bacterium]|nr:citrate/2-methylcitrate synthase [Gammaproteobacteria bacterium]
MTEADIPRGLEGVEVDETAVSLVDGDAGVLSYRGINIDQLVDRPFDEVAALVAYGNLDSQFAARLGESAGLSKRETALVISLPRQLHPMHVLQGLTPMLDPCDTFADFGEAAQGFAIAAKLPAIIATHMLGKAAAPHPELSHTDRFLTQIGAPDTAIARHAFNVTQILQIEHSFNASSFAARVTASTLAPVENALSAGFGTLHGKLHGGADQAALEVAESVGGAENANAFVDRCIAEKTKVMGMGHREYRVLDPRARHIKALAVELCKGTAHEETFHTLVAIEDRFRERMAENGKALHANVEFYKGVVYRVLGMTPPFFTTGFSMARVFGYLAHFIESRQDNKLIRPKARYVGPTVDEAA